MKPIGEKRILLVDDDDDYRRSLCGLLELDGYVAIEASTVEEGIELIKTDNLDLALIDIRLSDNADSYDLGGFTVANVGRSNNLPCIIITGHETVEAIRLALKTRDGAPLAVDFIPKVQGPQALLDSVKVVLANNEKSNANLKIDLSKGLVWLYGEEISLSRNQYALLAYLYKNEGVVCSPEELIFAVYNENTPIEQANTDRRLERLVKRVGEKIEADPDNPKFLLKAYGGRGYRLQLLSE